MATATPKAAEHDTDTLAGALAAFQASLPRVEKGNRGVVPGKEGKQGYCLDPATRVLTHDLTWTEVGKVAAGARLVAFDEQPQPGVRCRRWRSADVEATRPVTLPAYRVHLSNGTSVVASSTHRWLVINGAGHMTWADTADLRSRESHSGSCWYPHEIVSPVDTWADDVSREGGYLAGAFDGEGSLTMTPIERGAREHTYQLHLTFAQRENAMLMRVDAALAHLGFDVQRPAVGTGLNGDVRRLRVAGGRAAVLRFLGQVRPGRLLDLFSADKLGTLRTHRRVSVERIEFLGDRSLVAMQTSTRTLIAEGLASHNSYDYADLADVSAVALPLLGAVGLSWSTKPTVNEAGHFVLEYRLRHRSGEEDIGAYPLPDPGRTNAQQVGSAITYGRRYALCCVTGIAPGGDDDDGAAAQAAHPQVPAQRQGNGQGSRSPSRPPVPAQAKAAEDKSDNARQAATNLLKAETDQRVEWLTGKIEQNGDSGLDCTAHVPADDRETLGIEADEKLTLADLLTYVTSYRARRGHGPRQEAVPAADEDSQEAPADAS